MRQNVTSSFEGQLGDMLLRVVDSELKATQEMPSVVDLMEQHEVILSRVEGLARPIVLSEFDVAFTDWVHACKAATRITQTLSVVELENLLGSMGDP
jgi:hypothetical protein